MTDNAESDARALFDRALFQAFPGRMTHVGNKENADLLWSKMRGLMATVWADGFKAGRGADHNSTWWPENPYRSTPSDTAPQGSAP